MTEIDRGSHRSFDGSRLVPLMRVEDRLAASEIVAALWEEGIEAEWREPHSNWFDGLEQAWMGDQFGQILVLDMNLEKARGIAERLKEQRGAEGPPAGFRLPPE